MKSKLFFLLIFYAFFACVKEDEFNPHEIVIKKGDKVEYIELSDHFEIDVITLKKNENSLIGEVTKVVSNGNRLYILDKKITESLFVFNTKGEFLHKIGNKGKGKGEYLYIEDFFIFNDNIYILSGFDRKLLKFDFNGEFKSEILLEGHGGYAMGVNSNDGFFSIRANSLLSIYFWDLKGKIKKSIVDDKYSFINWGTSKAISYVGDSAYICPFLNDAIYYIDGCELKKAYQFNFGGNTYPLDDIKDKAQLKNAFNTRRYSTISAFTISEDFIYTNILSNGILHGLYFLKTQKMILSDNLFCNYIPVAMNVGETENGIIFTANANVVKLMLSKNPRHKFPKKLYKVSEEDNPIVFIAKYESRQNLMKN